MEKMERGAELGTSQVGVDNLDLERRRAGSCELVSLLDQSLWCLAPEMLRLVHPGNLQ